MPFYTYRSRQPETIDLSRNHFVSVIASHNTMGKCIPLYFRYIYQDGTYSDVAIDRIERTEEDLCRIRFYCYMTVNDIRRPVTLTYHKDFSKWSVRL